MSRREHGGSKPVNPEEVLRQEAAVYLSPAAEHQLAQVMQRREAVESALQRVDVEIYDLESAFLKHCVSYGGSLFDGFGLERHSNAHRNPVTVLTPLQSSSHLNGSGAITGSFDNTSTLGGTPTSPHPSTATAAAEHLRTYQFLTGASLGGSSGEGPDGNGSGASPAVFQVGSKGATSPAFHYRINFFSPTERVFSACSVGALSRVEIAKSTVEGANGAGRPLTVAAAARGQGLGKRGRLGSRSTATAAFAREPDAPPSRRRRRGDDGDDDAEDATAQNGEFGFRRRRHTG